MANARHAKQKSGGGFWDGVTGTIRNYEFTDDFVAPGGERFPFKDEKVQDKKTKKMVDPIHNLNMVIEAQAEGAEANTFLCQKFGKFDDWDVSDNGRTVTPTADKGMPSNKTAAGILIASIEAQGHACENADYDEGVYNYEPIIGVRARFEQVPYTEEELKAIERLGGSRKQKSKDGKEYDRKHLVVTEIYGVEEAEPVVAESKPNGKIKGAASGKKTAPAPEPEVDVAEMGAQKLLTYLEDARKADAKKRGVKEAKGIGALPKSKVKVKFMQDPELAEKLDLRDELLAWLKDDDNLVAIDEISYDRSDKNQMITLV